MALERAEHQELEHEPGPGQPQHDLALALLAAGSGGLLAPGESLQQERRHRGEQGAGHHSVVSLDRLIVVVTVFSRSDGLRNIINVKQDEVISTSSVLRS